LQLHKKRDQHTFTSETQTCTGFCNLVINFGESVVALQFSNRKKVKLISFECVLFSSVCSMVHNGKQMQNKTARKLRVKSN